MFCFDIYAVLPLRLDYFLKSIVKFVVLNQLNVLDYHEKGIP